MFVGHWPGRLGPVDDIRRGCVRTTYTYRGCARIGPMCVWNKSLGLFVPCTFARGPELQNSRQGGKAAVVKMNSLFGSMYEYCYAAHPSSPYSS